MGARDPVSVSPLNIFELEEEADDEHQQGDPMGIDCERLALAKEGESSREYWFLSPTINSDSRLLPSHKR